MEFEIQTQNGTLECEKIKWISPGEFLNYEFPPADTELVNLLSAK